MEPVPSFATVEEADAYNAAHLFGASWAPLSNEVKTQSLYTATQLINQNVKLAVVTDGSQPIPASLKNATSEYARLLATDSGNNPAEAGGTDGLKGLTVGPIEIDFAEPKESTAPKPYVVIPQHVLAMIAHLIVELVTPKSSSIFPLRAL